jgi:hypothetical protein
LDKVGLQPLQRNAQPGPEAYCGPLAARSTGLKEQRILHMESDYVLWEAEKLMRDGWRVVPEGTRVTLLPTDTPGFSVLKVFLLMEREAPSTD